MRTLTFAALLLVPGVVSAQSQMGSMIQPAATARGDSAEVRLLEIEQGVDEALLKEALTLLGKKEMKPPSERAKTDEAKETEQADALDLKKFIGSKKDAILARAEEL